MGIAGMIGCDSLLTDRTCGSSVVAGPDSGWQNQPTQHHPWVLGDQSQPSSRNRDTVGNRVERMAFWMDVHPIQPQNQPTQNPPTRVLSIETSQARVIELQLGTEFNAGCDILDGCPPHPISNQPNSRN